MKILWEFVIIALNLFIVISGTYGLWNCTEFALNEKIATGVVTSLVSEKRKQVPHDIDRYYVSINYDGYSKTFEYQYQMPEIGTKVNVFYSSENPLKSYTDKKLVSNFKEKSFWCKKDCLKSPYVLISKETRRPFWLRFKEYMDIGILFCPLILFSYLKLIGLPFIYFFGFNKKKYHQLCGVPLVVSFILIMIASY